MLDRAELEEGEQDVLEYFGPVQCRSQSLIIVSLFFFCLLTISVRAVPNNVSGILMMITIYLFI